MVLLLGLLFVPAGILAQDVDDDEEGFIFRANGPVTVAADEVVDTVIVANGDAVVDGRINDTLWVMSGDAIVEGTVGGDILMIDGTLSLAQGATVDNVTLIRSTLVRTEGATVTGDINEQTEFIDLGVGAAVFSVLFWVGFSIVAIGAALIFAWLGGSQLVASGDVITRRFGMSALTALILWVGLPVLAILAFVTVIGVPLGFAIVIFALPALWFLGYLVAGAKLGAIILDALGWERRTRLPLLAAGAGVFLLQLIGLIPGLGPLVILLAGLLGSGALIYRLVERPKEEPATVDQSQPQLVA